MGSHSAEPETPAEIPAPGWWAALRRAVRNIQRDDITDRAAALTYFGVLSIFPGLLVLVSCLGFAGKDTTQKFLDNVSQIAPGGVRTFLRTVIEQVQGRQGAAGIAAVVGLLLAIWSASGYVAAFMRATNVIYRVGEGRPIWRTAPVRLGITLATLVGLVISALMVVLTGSVAKQVGHAIGIGDAGVTAWDIAKWPVLIVIVSLMLSLLYWASPNAKQDGPIWVTPGGAIALLVWMIASGGFAAYVALSGSYNKAYGSLASVIVFLVWLWITNIAILLGAEINAELQRQRLIAAGLPEKVEPFVEVRDTRKLDPDEKHRVEEAARVREKTLAQRNGR
ncbi:MAG TPA: YihY/virulence factor BrkB family protein [Jatrophihabitantaceae bacterium]|nr:YihY/virulence factor BrkB family protein [Jatrophihabitantaceae bacterium]